MPDQLRWTKGALNAIKALRERAQDDGFLYPGHILAALAYGPLPGESVLGDALRNPNIWPDVHGFLQRAAAGQGRVGSTAMSVYGLELEAEHIARLEGVRQVGERHLFAAFEQVNLSQQGVHVEKLKNFVRDRELGPGFLPAEIQGRWHGLLETSIIIEYADVREIDWRAETGQGKVTLWVPGSVLNELDDLSFRGDTDRVRKKARMFSRGVLEGSKLDQALSPKGLPYATGTPCC